MSIARPVLSARARISAGACDRLFTIEQSTASVGATRRPVETWTTLGTQWMHRQDQRANERFVAAQQSASIETSWEFPYRADMDPDLVDVPRARRLVYSGRTYDITAASIIGSKRGIELLTVAKVVG